MTVALRSRWSKIYLCSFAVVLLLNVLLTSRATGYTQVAGGMQGSCPGERMATQVTGGEYQGRVVPEAIVNGEPWGGALFEAGVRTYWHCHPGGQILVLWDGEGRVQKRGQRARALARGESEYARPWEEHWHGGSPAEAGQYLQVSLEPQGTLWMEEVSQDDYLGNDIGITSRTEFLRTGVREPSRGR